MIFSRTYHGLELTVAQPGPEPDGRICYLLLPEGLKDDGTSFLEHAAADHGVTMVAVTGINWNDDLTPWIADGVFKKAKPFGGRADIFLRNLQEDVFPAVENLLGFHKAERYLVGISLSGLFAVWSCFKTDVFCGIASISGSLWYDGFASWASEHVGSLRPVGRIFISLGDREKRSKDKRMSTVEDATRQVVSVIQEACRDQASAVTFLLEEDTTHFSPLLPRLELALKYLL